MRGGILDRVFLNRVSEKGKKAYWIGQVVLVIGSVCLFYSDRNLVVVAALGSAIAWGLVCMNVWPRSDDEGQFTGGGVWCPACRRKELHRQRCMTCGGALEDMPG
jgi:hypothetical protein